MNLLALIAILIIREIACDGLDENFLFQIKSKSLPFLRSFDPVYYIRITTLLTNGAFDSIAPYHPTARGIYSNIQKRPENERTTRNKNIAIAYASLRILNNLIPGGRYIWENELISVGLDPNNTSRDLTTPFGIGNYAAENVLHFRLKDGMNQNGEANGKFYNKRIYENSIFYRPKNNEFVLDYPNNWQPIIETDDNGIFQAQVHIFPQLAFVKPYALKNTSLYEAPKPIKSSTCNIQGYIEQVQEILRESYTLNDKKKMAAEYFDDKTWSLDGSLENIIAKNELTLDEYVFLQLTVKIALFDSSIITWKEKLRYDAVRPYTAIRFLYENSTLRAWGGPGVGPVEDLKGREWRSYLRTPPHSEYPSASTCFCSAQAEVLRRYLKTNSLNHSVSFSEGSSKIEPLITPSENTTIQFNTFDEFVHVCGLSRLYGGVHFLTAINEAEKLCKLVGNAAYEYAYGLLNENLIK